MKKNWYKATKQTKKTHRRSPAARSPRPEKEPELQKLKQLIEINTYITNSLVKEEVLKRILHQVKDILKCESSSMLLADQELRILKFAIMSEDNESERLKDTGLKMGEGIAGTVWSNGMPLIINDPENDPRFSDIADRKACTRTRSIIAVPLAVDGKIIGVIESINKINGDFLPFDLTILQYISTQAAIAIKNADLYNMATRDGMTKLFLHKYFKERLIEEIARASRYSHPLSLVMFDIDQFKSFNDTYGHQAGDHILKNVADIIQQNCRDMDIACRYGGEEFTVILPETTIEDAYIFAERVRKAIESLKIPYGDHELQVTISGGIAATPPASPASMDEFIQMADQALYTSKADGRNCCYNFAPVQN